jgi:hypothetical protein
MKVGVFWDVATCGLVSSYSVFREAQCFVLSSQHTGNSNILTTPIRLARLNMWPPNKQLSRVIIINVLQIVFESFNSDHVNILIH